MKGKSVKESSLVMSQIMRQQDVNLAGNVHGGSMVKLMDTTAGIVAYRHTRTNVVTASIDRVDFLHPVYVGDLITLKASINFVGRTSMEVGVRIEAESIFTGEIRHTASAYLTYVSLNENGRPEPLPPIILESDEEIRRNREAQARREVRLREKSGQK